jgi:glycerol uptake facilitator-like aquaporin
MEVAHLRVVPKRTSRCFVEDDASASLVRRSLAEGIGTMMLMVVVVGAEIGGSGSPVASAVAVSSALIGLILAFGSVSGGHFNPVITIAQWQAGQRGIECVVWYVSAQVFGGIIGSLLADLMFALPPGKPSAELPNASAMTSEGLATFGLMMVVFCSSRSTSKLTGPFAVGLWLLAAIVATPTRSIANPAVAISLLASPSSASMFSVAAFIVVQLAGGSLAARCSDFLYPLQRR